MAYRFKLKEPIGKGLGRIGREQLEHAQVRLGDTGDAAAAVHDTRKSIKRLRALLRLVRSGLAKDDYRRLNTTLGDAGRALSATRDHDVLQATLARLGAEIPEVHAAARRLSTALSKQHGRTKSASRDTARQQAIELLESAREQWKALEVEVDDFSLLATGLKRGLDELEEACNIAVSGDDAAIHDWRKAVQRHWRHMRLVGAGWPEYFDARATEARRISELLGEAQDLTVLIDRLDARAPRVMAAADRKLLREHAARRRQALREAARAHSSRLLCEDAKDLARRASALWDSARTISADAEGTAKADATRTIAQTTVARPLRRSPATPRPRSRR